MLVVISLISEDNKSEEELAEDEDEDDNYAKESNVEKEGGRMQRSNHRLMRKNVTIMNTNCFIGQRSCVISINKSCYLIIFTLHICCVLIYGLLSIPQFIEHATSPENMDPKDKRESEHFEP